MGRQIVEKPRGLGSGASAMVHLRLRRETAKVDHGLFLARVSCTPAHHQQAHPHRPKIRDGELFLSRPLVTSTPPPPYALPRIRKAVGIDLGTTNSVIALLDPTDSVILTGQDEAGRRTFP